LFKVYDLLQTSLSFEEGWPGGHWPVSGEFEPVEFEIVVGAVLTQNTNWRNVERGLSRLTDAGLTDAGSVMNCPQSTLEDVIRPVGFFRKKSRVLKRVAGAILEFGGSFYSRVIREDLLSIEGIGPETADAILLYACARPEFVADAYARRILERYGLIVDTGYQEAKEVLEAHLPSRVSLYKRFHALLVEHAKQYCRNVPLCFRCILQENCKMALVQRAEILKTVDEGPQ
jgi:endonuclease-3 related protein